MRKPLAVLIFVLASASACSRVEQEVVSTLLSNYINAQEALASDDLVSVVQAFDGTAADADGDLKKIVQEISEARDLEAARSRFKELSDRMVEVDLPEGYIVVHCPVAEDGAGADWVQKEGEIANPYLGMAMRHCGEILEGK